jgi:hypothetical protein
MSTSKTTKRPTDSRIEIKRDTDLGGTEGAAADAVRGAVEHPAATFGQMVRWMCL